ncbi:hypothetical protein QYF36_025112 [Acer negundo]|nr:hypothetical protein QYF36_025112 [Acer negundo]
MDFQIPVVWSCQQAPPLHASMGSGNEKGAIAIYLAVADIMEKIQVSPSKDKTSPGLMELILKLPCGLESAALNLEFDKQYVDVTSLLLSSCLCFQKPRTSK